MKPIDMFGLGFRVYFLILFSLKLMKPIDMIGFISLSEKRIKK
jgi:hypothetical protein